MSDLYWWQPGIVKIPELEMKRSNSGGYVQATWGTLAFAQDTFVSPPEKVNVELSWGLTGNKAIHLFSGQAILRGYATREIRYDLYEQEFDEFLLEEGVNEEDAECFKPLVIGTVTHMFPQRTGEVAERRYFWPAFAGTPGNGINAYDDGYLINSQWTLNADGTISRGVNIVGQLSFSGTGTMKTLADVFAWACGRLGLGFVNVHGAEVPLDHVETNQQRLIDFLDKLAWYCNYVFYVKQDKLYLVSCDQDHGTQLLDEYAFVNSDYSWPLAIKFFEAEWETKRSETTAEEGQHLATDKHEVTIFSTKNTVGEERKVTDVFNESEALVRTRLTSILNREEKPTVSLSLPLDRLPAPGERIYFTDAKPNVTIRGNFFVRDISLNYQDKTVKVAGEGEVTFESL